MFYDTPPASKLAIAEREVGDVTILTLTGQILVDDGDVAIRKRVHELVDRGRVNVVLDLGGVTHIDSAGFGTMASKAKTVREHRGDLKLLRLTPRSQRLLSMMKLHQTFEAFDDEESAIRSFAGSQARP
jgi:anti-sigma B factor antagonist